MAAVLTKRAPVLVAAVATTPVALNKRAPASAALGPAVLIKRAPVLVAAGATTPVALNKRALVALVPVASVEWAAVVASLAAGVLAVSVEWAAVVAAACAATSTSATSAAGRSRSSVDRATCAGAAVHDKSLRS